MDASHKKVIIVAGAGDKKMILNNLKLHKLNIDDVVIVDPNDMDMFTPKDSEKSLRETESIKESLKEDKTHLIKNYPNVKDLYYPKEKHQPKGHQRPYKFHK